MRNTNSEAQEGSDRAPIEDIHQIDFISLGAGAATCQVCGSLLHEGDGVVVYVFRPAGSVRYQIGHVVCGDGNHTKLEVFTLGVRELVVEGRVGWCSDTVRQSSWPVLLAPEVVGVSAAATKTLRIVPETEREASGSALSVGTDAAYGVGRWEPDARVCGECGGEL